MNTSFDLLILGGGAAGMAAAIEAARLAPRARIALLEKLPRIGKKLLATGNGRCNLGHTPASLSCYHGSVSPAAAFASHGDTVSFFRSLGLLTRTDEAGRIYPLSNQATAVLDALRLGLEQYAIPVLCNQTVVKLQPQKWGFSVRTTSTENPDKPETVTYFSKRVLITSGGAAAPAFGTDGSLFALLNTLGHHPTKLIPALCPIPTERKQVRPLKGLRVQAACTAWKKNQLLARQSGEVQFTEQALSGICLFDLARTEPDTIQLDLLPQYSEAEVEQLLVECASLRSHAAVEDWLTGLFPKRIANALWKTVSSLPLDRPAPFPAASEWKRLASRIKDWRFPVTGRADWKQAQVTAGGIPAKEVTEALESVVCPGLFFAGECLDVDGDCGGYNLHWAWASGRYAAHGALSQIKS